MRRFFRKKTWVMVSSVAALLSAAIGIYNTIHSQLFLIQVVEVAEQPAEAPLDSQAILRLAAVPPGLVNLFDLDLKAVEKRIRENPWIRSVRLQKRFPQSLAIEVDFRKPVALFQESNGSLYYVDPEGVVFSPGDLKLCLDLPVLSGFSRDSEGRIREALALIELWERDLDRKKAELSTLSWDLERGFRALVAYPLSSGKLKARAVVDMGHEIDAHASEQIRRLSRLFGFLESHSIPARQIWADSGKKIIVKTARRS